MIKVNKQLEEKIGKLNFRLIEIITSFSPIQMKKELIIWLKQYSILNKHLYNIAKEQIKKESKGKIIHNYMNEWLKLDYAYLNGKMRVLLTTAEGIIEKIEDAQKLTKQEKNILKQSKESDELDYLG